MVDIMFIVAMLVIATLCDAIIELVVADTPDTPRLAIVQLKGVCWLNTT